MSVIFVSELDNVRERLGWKHPLTDVQIDILRKIVLFERSVEP